jgi:hypothetical protein
MPDERISEMIREANPVIGAPTRPIDVAWRELETAYELPRQRRIQPPRRVVTTWIHARRLCAVGAVILVIAGVSTFVGVRTSNTPSLTDSITRAFGVVNANGATAEAFATVPGSPQGLNDLSCPSADVCYLETTRAQPGVTPYVLATTAYKSVDGGVTWTSLTLPEVGDADTSMSCPSVEVCSLGLKTSPTSSQSPPVLGERTSQLMLSTSDGGISWTSHVVAINPVLGDNAALDPSLENVQGSWAQLQCFSASSCIALANAPSDQPVAASDGFEGVSRNVIMRTDDGGDTWTSNVLPWSNSMNGSPGSSNDQIMSLSCATAMNCMGLSTVFSVVDNEEQANVLVWRSDDGGAAWQTSWAPALAQISSFHLTCPTALQCYAPVGVKTSARAPGERDEIMSTSDGGVSWTFSAPAFAGSATSQIRFGDPSCTSASTCWISGEASEILTSAGLESSQVAIWATTDAGSTWTSVPLPRGLGFLFQVVCNAPSSCLASAQPPYPYKDGQPVSDGPPGELLSNQDS